MTEKTSREEIIEWAEHNESFNSWESLARELLGYLPNKSSELTTHHSLENFLETTHEREYG